MMPAWRVTLPASADERHEVELPAGGTLALRNGAERKLWEQAAERYRSEYGLVRTNDLVLLGALLTHQIFMYRAQQQLIDDDKAGREAQARLTKASEQIQQIEKSLGIDKKSRDTGGPQETHDFIGRLKRAANAKGVRISERVKAFESFNMALKTKIRVYRNGDEEDRAYLGLTADSIIDFCETELEKIEESEKEWAREHAAVIVGRL